MLSRTPYGVGPYGADAYRNALGPSDHFQKEKFIFAYQDVRGRYLSEDFQRATQRVFHGGAQASRLTLWLLPARF